MEMPIILNSKGNPILLNDAEKHNTKWMAQQLWNQYGPVKTMRNAVGYEIAITTLTTITKRVSEQKFYQFKPSEYIPIVAGEGQWSSNLETYRSFDVSDIFESGIINTGGNNDRLSAADAAVDALQIKVENWAKSLAYSIFDLELAAKSGNWDLVSQKEKSRKRNADLGIQRIAFLGAQGFNSGASASCLGLLNLPGITFNSTLITKSLSSMTFTEMNTFIQNSIQAYQLNCNYTAYPTHLIVPQSDFNGLVAQFNPEFPMLTKLQALMDAFKAITGNPNFKILPVVYAQFANGGGVLNSNVATGQYVFLNHDEESIRMNVPLPYTTSLVNSINNFQFQNVGYMQFTGVLALRPLEILYMGY